MHAEVGLAVSPCLRRLPTGVKHPMMAIVRYFGFLFDIFCFNNSISLLFWFIFVIWFPQFCETNPLFPYFKHNLVFNKCLSDSVCPSVHHLGWHINSATSCFLCYLFLLIISDFCQGIDSSCLSFSCYYFKIREWVLLVLGFEIHS